MDKIIEKTITETHNPKFLIQLITEARKSIEIPKILRSKSARRRLLEEAGADAFLDPDRLRFPIVDPTNRKCVESCTPSCKLLLASLFEMKTKSNPGNREMMNKAKRLIRENKCSSGIGFHLEGLDEVLDIETILYYFDDDLEE